MQIHASMHEIEAFGRRIKSTEWMNKKSHASSFIDQQNKKQSFSSSWFRLEHAVLDNPTTIPSTPYHVAAEQNLDDEYDRVSLNCEDGSLSSQSNEENLSNQSTLPLPTTTGVLDFSLKLTDINQSSNRTRSLNTSNKSRSLKRKHPNGNNDHGTNASNISNRIFHADAFCSICRKVSFSMRDLTKSHRQFFLVVLI